jgi:DNA integrity scanning protein DisA with diadenylate cyclase activity
MELSQAVVKSALELAKSIKADAILVLTETGKAYDIVVSHKPELPVIAATPDDETFGQLVKKAMISTLNIEFLDVKKEDSVEKTYAIKLMTRELSRSALVQDALTVARYKGILREGDIVVVVGSSLRGEGDSIFVHEIKKDSLDLALYDLMREVKIKQEVFESVLTLALEIGREGRAGRLIGTAFLIGGSKEVLERSKQLLLNPFEGHAIGERVITNPDIYETIKELAQLDGVFVITEDGVIESAGRYLTVDASKIDIPRGLGTRHAAVAAMTKETNAIGVTVSQSGGIVRVFKDGRVIMTIEPQRKITLRTESIKGTFTKVHKP